ncbi:hypothetical protein HK104_005005, partial [Borealophlyctis nickersoniae]
MPTQPIPARSPTTNEDDDEAFSQTSVFFPPRSQPTPSQNASTSGTKRKRTNLPGSTTKRKKVALTKVGSREGLRSVVGPKLARAGTLETYFLGANGRVANGSEEGNTSDGGIVRDDVGDQGEEGSVVSGSWTDPKRDEASTPYEGEDIETIEFWEREESKTVVEASCGAQSSAEEAYGCPVCGETIIFYSLEDRQQHVNRCLDGIVDCDAGSSVPSREEQRDGWARVFSSVKNKVGGMLGVGAGKKVESKPVQTSRGAYGKGNGHNSRSSATVPPPPLAARTENGHVAARTENSAGSALGTSSKPNTIDHKAQQPPSVRQSTVRRISTADRDSPALSGASTHSASGQEGGYTGDTHGRGQVRRNRQCPWWKRMPGSLVIQQLRVAPHYIVKLPMNTPVDVMGVRVTLIEANHCPGAVLFLFEIPTSGDPIRYLHTGDFRAHGSHLCHPALVNVPLNTIYLDTTYCRPSHRFPSQDEVISTCAELARRVCVEGETVQEVVSGAGKQREKPQGAAGVLKRWVQWGVNKEATSSSGATQRRIPWKLPARKKRTLVVVGTYTIGKEKIFVGVAKAIGSKVYADARKRRVLACLEDPELDALLTSNPAEADVHVVPMGHLKAE